MNNSIWKVYSKKADFKEIGRRFGIDQVIARIIRNRDIIGEEALREYLYGDLQSLHPPLLMKGMEAAVSLLRTTIEKTEQIRIIGDYDIDGICSIYILYRGLQQAGAKVDYVVPDRIADGYGINENLIRQAYEDGIKLVITCDNGIAACSAVAYAKSLGMRMIITDHHEVPFEDMAPSNTVDGEKKCVGDKDNTVARAVRYILPPADVIVNPKQPGCPYPYKELCGAAIAWKLVTALLDRTVEDSLLQELMEFAAIATVGDIVQLLGENRIIVKCGLRSIHQGTPNLGLRTLIRECGVQEGALSAYHIGFVVGPCLNASGRLESAAKAIRLLQETDEQKARMQAQHLKALNDERKRMTEQGVEAAAGEIAKRYGKDLPKVLVVYLENCHESVAGIIAGRVRECFYRPVIIFTDAIGEDNMLKGSGRSIPEYNMFEEISAVKELLSKFGGHPMAAGMSMAKEYLPEFDQRLNTAAKRLSLPDAQVRWIDVPMTVDYVNETVAAQLSVLEPFGKDNEKPLFADKNLTAAKYSLVGKEKNVLKMTLVSPNGRAIDAVKFHAQEEDITLAVSGKKIAVLYYPGFNEYRGQRNLQLVVTELAESR